VKKVTYNSGCDDEKNKSINCIEFEFFENLLGQFKENYYAIVGWVYLATHSFSKTCNAESESKFLKTFSVVLS
jgi:hypothetical protein